MRLSLILVAAGAMGTAAAALAQDAGPGRYEIKPSDDGFIRLDTDTGAMTHCSKRDGVWHCDILAEDRSAIAALSTDVARLRSEVAALAARIAALEARKPVAVAPPPQAAPPASFAELMMRRFFEMVRDMKGPCWQVEPCRRAGNSE